MLEELKNDEEGQVRLDLNTMSTAIAALAFTTVMGLRL